MSPDSEAAALANEAALLASRLEDVALDLQEFTEVQKRANKQRLPEDRVSLGTLSQCQTWLLKAVALLRTGPDNGQPWA